MRIKLAQILYGFDNGLINGRPRTEVGRLRAQGTVAEHAAGIRQCWHQAKTRSSRALPDNTALGLQQVLRMLRGWEMLLASAF